MSNKYWIEKQNDVDDILAEDFNEAFNLISKDVENIEEDIKDLQENDTKTNAQSATYIFCASDTTHKDGAIQANNIVDTLNGMFENGAIPENSTIFIREGSYAGATEDFHIYAPCSIVCNNPNGIKELVSGNYAFNNIVIEADNTILDGIKCRGLTVKANKCIIKNCSVYSGLSIEGNFNKVLNNYQNSGNINFAEQVVGNVVYGNRNNDGINMPSYVGLTDYIIANNDIETAKNSELVTKDGVTAQTATYIIAAEDTPNNSGCIIATDLAKTITNLINSADFVEGSRILIRNGSYDYTTIDGIEINKSCHISTEFRRFTNGVHNISVNAQAILEGLNTSYIYINANDVSVVNCNVNSIDLYANNIKLINNTVSEIEFRNNTGCIVTNNRNGIELPKYFIRDMNNGDELPLTDEFLSLNDIETMTSSEISKSISGFEDALDAAIALCDSYIGGDSE